MKKNPTTSVPGQPFPDPLGLVFRHRSINLISGASGIGKTALMADMLNRFRTGAPIFGHTPARITDIGVIAADRDWEGGAGPWFVRAGFPDAKHYSFVDDPTFDPDTLDSLTERPKRLAEMLDKLEMKPGGIVLVDPIAAFLGGKPNDYDLNMRSCLKIRKLLRLRELTIFGTAHIGKMKADKRERFLRPQDAILGSAGQLAYADTQCYLAAPEEQETPYYTFLWHPHLVPPETFALERDRQGLFVPYSGADRENCRGILALLPENGTPMVLAMLLELAEQIPLSRRTVIRVLQTLVEEGTVEKVKHGTYARVVAH